MTVNPSFDPTTKKGIFDPITKRIATCGTFTPSCGLCPDLLYVTFKDFVYDDTICVCQVFTLRDKGVGIGGGFHLITYQYRINQLLLNGTQFTLSFQGNNGIFCVWKGIVACDVDLWFPHEGSSTGDMDCSSDPDLKITQLDITLFKPPSSSSITGTSIRGLQVDTTVPVTLSDSVGVYGASSIRLLFFEGTLPEVLDSTDCFEANIFCNVITPDMPFDAFVSISDFGQQCSTMSERPLRGFGDGCAIVKQTSSPPTFDCTDGGCISPSWSQARSCATGELIDVWVYTFFANAYYANGFHVLGSAPVICGYFDPADDPTDTPAGTTYEVGQLVKQSSCGTCPAYVQARSCDTGELIDVWMSIEESLGGGTWYMSSHPYQCFYFDSSRDPTHDGPLGTLYRFWEVNVSLFPCNRCPGYLQALKCSDNSPADWWMKLPAANSVGFDQAFTVNPEVGGDGVTCYHFVSGQTIEAIPGTVIDPTTDITTRGDCAACLKYCYYKYSSSFVCPDGPWTTPVLVATQCLSEDPDTLNEWHVAPVAAGSTSAIWWQKGGECQEDGDCPEDPNDPPDAPITVPGDCGADCEDVSWFTACSGSSHYNTTTPGHGGAMSTASFSWSVPSGTLTSIPNSGTISDLPGNAFLSWETTAGDLTYHFEVSGCSDPGSLAQTIIWIQNNVTGERIDFGTVNADPLLMADATTTTVTGSASGMSYSVTDTDGDLTEFESGADLSATVDNVCPHP